MTHSSKHDEHGLDARLASMEQREAFMTKALAQSEALFQQMAADSIAVGAAVLQMRQELERTRAMVVYLQAMRATKHGARP